MGGPKCKIDMMANGIHTLYEFNQDYCLAVYGDIIVRYMGGANITTIATHGESRPHDSLAGIVNITGVYGNGPLPFPKKNDSDDLPAAAVVGIVVALVVFILLLVFGICYCRQRGHRQAVAAVGPKQQVANVTTV